MARPGSSYAFLVAALALVGAPSARAEGPAPAAAKPAVLASDEEVAKALVKFKEDWKAKGLKGEDRLSQREFAMRELAKHQHAKVVEELASVSRDPDPTLRMIGVIYLGDMTLLPGAAGPKVVAALKAGKSDPVMVLTCLQSIGNLKYLGARAELKDALRDQSFAVKKAAIDSIGRTGDLRLMREMLEVIGIDLGDDPSAAQDANEGKEVVEEGYSWEGAEATVDTGTAGDGDQKAAEAKVKAQLAANQAAAQKNSGSSGGGGSGGGDGGGGVGRGGTARSTEELLYPIVAALKRMTGRSFTGPKDFRKWHKEHRADLAEKAKALDEQERAQKVAAK